jgi:hypothetical protein
MEADFGTVVEELKRNNAEEAKRDGYRLNQATSHSQKNTELLERLTDSNEQNVEAQETANELNEGNASADEEEKQERNAQNLRLVDGLNKIGSGIKGLIQRSKDFVGETPSVIKALLTAGAFFALAKFLQSSFVQKVVVNIILRLKKLVTDIMGLFEGEFTFGKLFTVIRENFLTILGVLAVLKPKMMFNLIKSSLFALAGLIDNIGKQADDTVKQTKFGKIFGKLKDSFKGLTSGIGKIGDRIKQEAHLGLYKKGTIDKFIKDKFKGAGRMISGSLSSMGNGIRGAYGALSKVSLKSTAGLITKGMTAMMTFLGRMTMMLIMPFKILGAALIANPIGLAIAAIVGIFIYIGKKLGIFKKLGEFLSGLFDKIVGAFKSLYNYFANSRIGKMFGLKPITDEPQGTSPSAGDVDDTVSGGGKVGAETGVESPTPAEKQLTAQEIQANAVSKAMALFGGQKGSQIIQTNVNNSKTTSSKNVTSNSTSIIDNNPIYRTINSQATA